MCKEFIVRIKPGAFIGQDHSFSHWPNCCPPRRDFNPDGSNPYCAKDPDMLFLATWRNGYWNCVADGYGAGEDKETEYGCGSIYVFKEYGVEIVG